MTNQFGLRVSAACNLYVPGQLLCSMNNDDFCARAPNAGDTLFAQLQIWKTAVELSHSSTAANNSERCNDAIQEWSSRHFDHLPTQVINDEERFFMQFEKQIQPTATKSHVHSPSTSDSGISTDLDDMCNHLYDYTNVRSNSMSTQLMFDGVTRLPALQNYSLPNNIQPQCGVIIRPLQRDISAHQQPQQHNIHLWQFLRDLLDDKASQYATVLRWIERRTGTFKIENSHELARLWGARKNRCKMNYDKLSRSLRQYYKKGILRKTGQRQRLIYQFCTPYMLD
jgi:hypothetical protein